MRSFFWIKLHHAILDDPKMGLLPDALWRRVIELFLLAGEMHAQGVLPPLRDMVWRLHTTDDTLAEELAQLSELGIVEQRDGGWFVTDFARLQAPAASTERSQNHRARQRRFAYEVAQDGTSSGDEPEEQTDAEIGDRSEETGTQQGQVRYAAGTKRPTDKDRDGDIDIDVDTAPAGGATSARDPPPSKRPATQKRQPFTEGQRQFLELFGASRYRNETQKNTIVELEQTHGIEALLDKGRWAAKLGMGLGKAVIAVESAFKNERTNDGRNEKQSTGAGQRRGRVAGRGINARSDEEVQRGLTRDRMDAKLARLERADGGAATSHPENV
jgi:hypothetical protein